MDQRLQREHDPRKQSWRKAFKIDHANKALPPLSLAQVAASVCASPYEGLTQRLHASGRNPVLAIASTPDSGDTPSTA